MDLSVCFLGTGATSPTRTRGLTSCLVMRGSDRVLVDCGEGTQRALLLAEVSQAMIPLVLLTHGHSDHYMGLPGLLKGWSAQGRWDPLEIYGPPGTWQLVRAMTGFIGPLRYELEIREITRGEPILRDGYRIDPVATHHRISSLGWAFVEDGRPGRFDAEQARALGVAEGPELGRLARGETLTLAGGAEIDGADLIGPQRPGRRVVVSGDTTPCETLERAATGADLLVMEATFLEADAALADKAAHSTALQAGALARRAGVRSLALTHISSRYETIEVLSEARREFPEAIIPDDYDRISVTHRD